MSVNKSTVLCIFIVVLVAFALYSLNSQQNEKYDYAIQDLPTLPEVELIEGRPDFDVVDETSGMELIHEGDIALNPGFGIGEGLVGFGRYGSSFMA